MDPVNWQQRYLDQDTPWDKGRAHPMIKKAADYWIPGDRLVPGCGLGWDACALRDQCQDSHVIGLDLSALAIKSASELHGDDRLIWITDNIFRSDDDARFSSVTNVWEHTCLCALPPAMRHAYVNRIAELLPVGGMLCGAFFTHMDDGGSGPPWNTSPEELRLIYQPYFEILELTSATESFPARSGEESFAVMRRKK